MAKHKQERHWHPEFIKYTEYIVKHKNYAGMPDPRKKDGSVKWVVTGKSELGQARTKWWDKKRAELGVDKQGPWMSKVARLNHPTGKKPCQTCGRILNLDYVYPTKPLLSRINKITNGKKSFTQLQPIQEIIDKINDLNIIKIIFKIPDNISKSKTGYLKYVLENRTAFLSPGAMSNPPDRFDGYHSYNLCCRSKEDTGRHRENLMRYGEDRRAYEFWSDGDWKAASWLMQEFKKHKTSPDHIGPLSLGFAHRPRFKPMTRLQNIGKGNRMTYNDVQTLIQDENKGENVVSWHSKFIWDLIKHEVKNDEDALKLSKLMRTNLHYVIRILYLIHKMKHDDFLVKNFLHPEYAKYSIEFIGFDPRNGTFGKMIKTEGDKKQYENNAKRYIRKSLEALEEYEEKDNRRHSHWSDKELDSLVQRILQFLKQSKDVDAKIFINEFLKKLAQSALLVFKNK